VDLPTFAIPFLIFLAEVCALTVSTLRIIFVSRGHKILAPLLGFFEIMIWLFAIGETMRNLDNWVCFIAFALGFTLGNYFGILIDKRLALGTAIVRVITHRNVTALIERLRAANFGVTAIDAFGATGKVQIVMTIVKRKQLPEVIALIDMHQPGAFYAVEDVQSASDGTFPAVARPNVVPTPLMKVMRYLLPSMRDDLANEASCQR